MNTLTDKQSLRYDLLKANNYDVENSKACYDFVEGESKETTADIGYDTLPDGIHLIFSSLKAVSKPYTPGAVTDKDKADCTGIGIKLGGKSLIIALWDFAGGEDITLTVKKDTTDYDGYIDNCIDATADWNGKANTEHLKKVGLNPAIWLQGDEYIPSLGEMRFIQLFRKKINQALIEVGGDELRGWYWTSTEYSSTDAWLLYLYDGLASFTTKTAIQSRVRAVSAFSSLNS